VAETIEPMPTQIDQQHFARDLVEKARAKGGAGRSPSDQDGARDRDPMKRATRGGADGYGPVV
jgi:hypothetical protein